MANPKNINSLQLLRNAELFASKDAAISQIKAAGTNDGTIKLARYEVSGTGDTKEVKTIFGIYYKGASGGSYTIYDSPQEVIEALKNRVTTAEGKIDTLNGDSGTTGSVAKSIKDAIEALDVTWEGGTGKVITAITETDGKIAATYTDLSAANVAATAFEAADDKVAVTGATVEAQIESLAKSVKATSAAAKTYSISAVTLADENVKEAYALFDEKNAQVGETIKIYKDSSLVSLYAAKEDTGGTITVGDKKYSKNTSGQTLIYEYINAAGETEYAAVDLGNFLIEEEFKNGLQVSGGTVSIKLAEGNEGFLTVDEGGLKLSGVQDAINEKVNGLDATVSAQTSGHHVTVKVEQVDGKLTEVAVTEDDIASASALTAETSAREAEDAKIVAGVGFATKDNAYVISANTGDNKSLSAESYTVANALYTLDDAIAAAKKANTLVKADETVVVGEKDGNTTVKVNIASATSVSNFVGYASDGSFVKSDKISVIDAGFYDAE